MTIFVKAPAVNYHGYALAKVIGETHDTWGQSLVRVKALHGEPWTDAGLFGYSPTSMATFYPEHLEVIKIEKEQE